MWESSFLLSLQFLTGNNTKPKIGKQKKKPCYFMVHWVLLFTPYHVNKKTSLCWFSQNRMFHMNHLHVFVFMNHTLDRCKVVTRNVWTVTEHSCPVAYVHLHLLYLLYTVFLPWVQNRRKKVHLTHFISMKQELKLLTSLIFIQNGLKICMKL